MSKSVQQSSLTPAGVAQLALAVMLLGCGSGHGPSASVSLVRLTLYTSEYEPERSLMVVGENGSAWVVTETNDCLFESPCELSADAELRSSDPAVVSPERQRFRAPGTIALIARAPGSATITATSGGVSSVSKQVDVVSAPLPLDALQVVLRSQWNDLPAEYDSSESLISVSVPLGQSGALQVTPFRDDKPVWGISLTISSSDPAVALGTLRCRPESIDPQCSTGSDAWVTGVAPGDAQITISARNQSSTFTAHVSPSP